MHLSLGVGKGEIEGTESKQSLVLLPMFLSKLIIIPFMLLDFHF